MGIENIGTFDYSTTDKIDGTLQDKIDELKNTTKKSLQELSKEVFLNLSTLTVDTLNTRLNVRDIDGVIIGKLEDKAKISYLNKHIEKDGKIFVKIQQTNGKSGYVSADYVRADGLDQKVQANESISNTSDTIESTELLSKKTELSQLTSKITDSEKKSDILEKINQCTTTQTCTILLEEINIILKNQKLPESDNILEKLNTEKDKLSQLSSQITDSEKKSEILNKIKICITIEDCNTLLEEINSVLESQENLKEEEIDINKLKNTIDFQFSAFIETIKQIDTLFDTQTSEEKRDNEELLEVNHNALNGTLKIAEKIPELKEKVIEIKLYLATFYADEGEVENSNFSNYKLSNEIAFDVLKDAQGIEHPPKAPDMGEIISSFKGTGVGTYITTEINKGTEISEIFNSSIVKNKTEEQGEKLVDEYKDSLEEYLEGLDANHRHKLDKNQEKALDLLMDVNGAGWSIANSTTDMWDVMGWDFAAIGAGIGTGMATGALVGTAGTPVGTVIGGITGAVVGGVVATGGMMLNHGDNYFNTEDYSKGLTELGINTLMFGAGGAAMKAANGFRGTEAILSARGLTALSGEMIADISIGVSSDVTRAWAYDMNIDLSDAVFNNLVWALIPLATIPGSKAMSKFSQARKQLATETTEIQQKASLLSRLGDKTGAKKLIEKFNEKIKSLKGKNKTAEKEVKINKETENNQSTKVEKNTGETIYVHKTTGKEYVFISEGKNGKINAKNENGTRVSVNKDNIELKSKTETKETINDKDFNIFIKDKKVSDEILNNIAQKLSKNEKLSLREEQIRQIKSDKINQILEGKVNKTETKDTKEKTTETSPKEIDISKILKKDLNSLKEGGDSIKHGNYETRLKDGEYILSGPDGYNMTFTKKEGVINALNKQLGDNISKINTIIDGGHKEALAKLNTLSKNKDGFDIDGKNIRFKKDGEGFKLEEITPDGIKKLDINSLTVKQRENLLEKIIGAKGLSQFKTLIEKITPEKLLSKSEKENFIKKYGKDKYKGFIKEVKEASKSTGSFIMWLLRGKKGGVFSKITMAGGVLANESIEAMTNTQDYMDEFGSWTHGANIVGNALLMKQFGILRGLIYSEVSDDLTDSTLELFE